MMINSIVKGTRYPVVLASFDSSVENMDGMKVLRGLDERFNMLRSGEEHIAL